MSDADREQLLACLLEGLIEQSRDGRTPDLERVIRDHPELSVELRELWATAMIAEDFGSLSSDLFAPTIVPSSDDAYAVIVDNAGHQVPQQFGDYQLLEEIGRGGMGVVFKARQASLDRIVAVKMILRGGLATAADVARFRAEAKLAVKLNHPHIVPVYEVGEVSGQPYFSMKYIEGTTLAQRLVDGPLPPREIAELLAPVASAIAEAHRHGVLHRDLKPSNILVDQQQRPYVTDFGLAKRIPTDPVADGNEAPFSAHLTETGAILGTPGYMAPEQAAGRRGSVTAATDVYGLGAVLYALLTGRAPFQAASPLDAVMIVLEQDPLPPRLLNRRVDPDLEMIALKCLQKPADLRYAGAAELADDLNAYLAGDPISARSSQFSQVIIRVFRETHHATVLEKWGLLWMWHSLVLLALCLVTNWFQWQQYTSRWPYLSLWGVGLGTWAGIFWNLRRRAGPVTFVERQIAHVWAGSMISSTGLFLIEWILALEVLQLSPVLGLVSGMVFLVKASVLSGTFYLQAVALFATAAGMAWLQHVSRTTATVDFGISLFGVVSAACFFLPGLKYYRQRIRQKSVVRIVGERLV